MNWHAAAIHFLNYTLYAVALFNVWLMMSFTFATFVISVQTKGTEIMWREGWQETMNQLDAFLEWLV